MIMVRKVFVLRAATLGACPGDAVGDDEQEEIRTSFKASYTAQYPSPHLRFANTLLQATLRRP